MHSESEHLLGDAASYDRRAKADLVSESPINYRPLAKGMATAHAHPVARNVFLTASQLIGEVLVLLVVMDQFKPANRMRRKVRPPLSPHFPSDPAPVSSPS